MNTKLYFLLIAALIFSACSKEQLKKKDVEQLIEQEMKGISFHEVDIYPNFTTCTTSENKTVTKSCFIETLHEKLVVFWEENEINQHYCELTIEVSNQGNLTVLAVKDANAASVENLKLQLNDFLAKKLPEINPAQKQGVPVHCKFVLPIKITNET
ncbi:hypothetical protein [Psychroflexus salis]|uniref:hypothetical protein n=1 Tax=Psychroflexus salis TaxID=1526574 RepID=UPI0016640E32|nr:hypothetical protein [Psychroflexus salis]